MKQHQRIISGFLALCMVFSMPPMQAFASETEPTEETIATETVPEESVVETTVPTEVVPAPTEAELEPTEAPPAPTEDEPEPTAEITVPVDTEIVQPDETMSVEKTVESISTIEENYHYESTQAVDQVVRATKLTLSQLQEKFPDGKYWNHNGGGSSNNNPDGYTSTPCGSCHGRNTCPNQPSDCFCNKFDGAVQCKGFALKLAYDYYGSSPRTWNTGTLDNLKAGDYIRYKNNGHSIWVTAVNGDTITYADCNSDDRCIIRWNKSISKSEVAKTLTEVKSAPNVLNNGSSNPTYADLGTDFTAPIIYKALWSAGNGAYLIENSYTEGDKPPVRIQNENGKANQLWYFSRQSDGSYMISSCQDGKYLDVRDAGTGTGVVIQTCEASGSDAQKWYLIEKDGGYIIKSKLSGCVLDLVNNNAASGNTIQTWEQNGTSAQIWAIYRGDECKLKGPTLSVSAGTSAVKTTFTWNSAYGAREYNLKIWTGEAWVGEPYHIEWGTTSGCSVQLPAGTYQAYVDAVHYYEFKSSNVVTFTVKDVAEYTISYNANGGSGAPGSQTKTHGVNLTLSSTKPTRTGYTFLGWGTSASSNVVLYQPGGTYNSNANVVLYAIWKANPVTITSSASSISLELGGTESQTITVTKDGTYIGNNGRWTMNAQTSDDSIVSTTWGNKTGESSATLTLTAKSVGNATVILSIIDYDSREIIASCQVSVSVTAKTYSISFDSNGGSNTPASQVKQHGTNLVLTSSEPTGTGFTVTFQGNGGTVSTTSKIVKKEFASWNTEAKGSGSSYSPGSIYSANAAVTLYAQWDNAVLGSTTVPTRSDYLFAGWYDSASVDNNGNPTGTMYNASSKITKNTTLYAMWLPEDILLYGDYDRNGVVDITDINSVNKYINGKVDAPYDVEELLLRCDLNRNEKIDTSDYSIMNELRLGTKTQFDMLENYTLTYINKIPNTNYQYGEELNTVGTELNINFNGGSTDYAITEGLSFSGYDPYTLGAQTVTVHFYQFSDTYEVTVSQPKYTVSYNANGGNGAPASQTAVLGSTLTVATTIPTRFGYNFKGWTVKGETEVYYLPGSNISAQTDVELYAVWNKYSISLKNTDIGKSAVNIEYPGEGCYFIVEPEITTSYLIYSEGNVDSKVYLYNSQGELIAQDDDSGSLNNYRLEVDLQSGETYYIYAKLYSSSHTGSYDFAIRRGYWLTYDANGGANAPESEYKYNYYDMEISNTEPTRDGYVFQGWSENKDSDIATYKPGDPITTNWGWKLYAVWTPYSVEEHDWQDATCTQPKTCKICGQTSGTALGHTEKVLPAKAATCTATGLTEGKHCSVCSEVLVAQEIVAALGHTEVIDKAVAATCTENGLTEGKHCSVCGEILVAQTDVAKLGHDYKEITVEPTCTEHGKTTFTCSRCDDEYFTTAPALGHTEVADKAVAATCTAAGKTEGKHCSVCNAVLVEQETLSALGHKWTAADCDTPKTCSVCKATEGKALGHSYDDNVDGTCNSCGVNRETVEIRQVTHMLRMYNPYTGEHFYTGSEVERDNLVAVGWNYEGVAFTFPGNTGAPVYRLYDPATGEHLYTMDEEERATLEATGWNYEGIAFNSAYDTEAVQHRLHNPYATVGAYHFTFSDEEKQNLINAGWEYQGIGWYSCWK